MREDVERALAIDAHSSAAERTVDITTVGRRSGKSRRIEIWFYRADGVVYLSGTPGRRGWAQNLEAEPAFTFHLKNGVDADLPARARKIDDEEERRRILGSFVEELNQPSNPGRLSRPARLEDWMAGSPLFEVEFDRPKGL